MVCAWFCSVRGVRADGLLWHFVEPSVVPDERAAPGHGDVGQQRHKLGGNHLDVAHHRCLHHRCAPRPLSHLHGGLHYLPPRKFQFCLFLLFVCVTLVWQYARAIRTAAYPSIMRWQLEANCVSSVREEHIGNVIRVSSCREQILFF